VVAEYVDAKCGRFVGSLLIPTRIKQSNHVGWKSPPTYVYTI